MRCGGGGCGGVEVGDECSLRKGMYGWVLAGGVCLWVGGKGGGGVGGEMGKRCVCLCVC